MSPSNGVHSKLLDHNVRSQNWICHTIQDVQQVIEIFQREPRLPFKKKKSNKAHLSEAVMSSEERKKGRRNFFSCLLCLFCVLIHICYGKCMAKQHDYREKIFLAII